MIPNIFVSSTIEDLHHLRDAVRETILELGYQAILSEHGEVGYLPSHSAIESCYAALQDCQLAVLIIGKRYGPLDKTGRSVTHNEFRTAREQSIPTLTLVDRDVVAFSHVHAANASVQQVFPGMDAPEKTFSFLREVSDSVVNNGVLPFLTATEARSQLKRQIAHLFGDLLRRRFDHTQVQISDVISEIKTLRHEIRGEPPSVESTKFLHAMRFLLEDRKRSQHLLAVASAIAGTVDRAVTIALESPTLTDFVRAAGVEIEMNDALSPTVGGEDSNVLRAWGWVDAGADGDALAVVRHRVDHRLEMNQYAFDRLRATYDQLIAFVDRESKLTSR